jgi:tetratricopeptide (TPR) repeat protein
MNFSASNSSAPFPAGYRTIAAQRVLPVFLGVLAVIAAVATVDVWLAGIAGRHRSHIGQQLFNRGVAASKEGRQAEALELFRGAFNHSPSRSEYHLAFARSLRENARLEESRVTLQNLLQQSPTYGPANAEFARMLAAAGDWPQASWYFHRALYGEWRDSPDLRPLRFELADLLARHDATDQLLAEVLMLEATGGRELDARHMAQLWLAAGDWARAEREYRSLLNESRADAGLLVGLARAQFGAGRYLAAERSFQRAMRSGAATSSAVERELELAKAVNESDPTIRRLPSAEKHRRSHELASLLLQPLSGCAPGNPQVTKASVELNAHQRLKNASAAADADLELFEELWASRKTICPSGTRYPPTVELLASQWVK